MSKKVHDHPNLILSVGTQVVTLKEIVAENGRTLHPRGSVGVVVKSPRDLRQSYRVRFPDGVEKRLKQHELGKEKERLESADFDFHEREYQRLRVELESAFVESDLPEVPTATEALNDLLVRLRIEPTGSAER